MMIARRKSVIVYVIGIIMFLVVTAGSAYGQFIVQPMMFELAFTSGQRSIQDIQLQNHDPNTTIDVGLAVADLSQYEDGSWRVVEPDSNDIDISKLASCRNWISLSNQTASLAPLSVGHVKATFQVPSGVYGFYSAAIIVSVMRMSVTKDIGLILQFEVPVLVRISGRVVQHNIELTGIGMEIRQAGEESTATTMVSINVANSGSTFSRLMGRIRVWGFFKDHWRRITDREIRGASILPGSMLRLEGDVGRSLPAGKYRLWGGVYVDGMRIKPIEKEIDFAGNPGATKVSTDAALEIDPRDIVIESLPGATRTTVLQVFNASDEEVNVKVRKALPLKLMGVAAGPLKGEYLDCTGWLDIEPKEFSLSSYGKQNIRIITKMPNPEAMFPSYYALIGLFATYPDGVNAGTITANVCVINRGIKAPVVARSSGDIRLALQTESKYFVTCGFTNYGYIHFTPKSCIAKVMNIQGAPMSQVALSGERSIMLPLESRDFSGELDFSDYPAGLYRIEVSLESGADEPQAIAINQIGIQVSADGAKRSINIVGREEFEKVGVKWR